MIAFALNIKIWYNINDVNFKCLLSSYRQDKKEEILENFDIVVSHSRNEGSINHRRKRRLKR